MAMAVLPDQMSKTRPDTQPTPFDLDILPTPATQEGSSGLPADTLAEMRRIQQEVIEIRQLLPEYEIPRSFLTPEELKSIVADEFFSNYTEENAEVEAKVLSMFGLVEPDLDLFQFYQDLYTEQVAGFYDPLNDEMKVIKASDFNVNTQSTYAHEYSHTLQDQNFEIEEILRYTDEDCQNETDRCDAVQALIEGDSSLLEYFWQHNTLSDQEIRDWLSGTLNTQFPFINAAPPYFFQDLYFPYLYGLNFVSYLYERGGWDAVNAAYKNPPITTEQIMHPERYPDDKPQEVHIPAMNSTNMKDYELIDEGEVGEWFTFLHLTQGVSEGSRLDEPTAWQAASGWDGGYYKLFEDLYFHRTVFVTCNVWDTPEDAQEYYSAFKSYGNLRWAASILEKEGETIWRGGETFINFKIKNLRTCWTQAPSWYTMESASITAMGPAE